MVTRISAALFALHLLHSGDNPAPDATAGLPGLTTAMPALAPLADMCRAAPASCREIALSAMKAADTEAPARSRRQELDRIGLSVLIAARD